MEWHLLHVAIVDLRDDVFIGRLFFGTPLPSPNPPSHKIPQAIRKAERSGGTATVDHLTLAGCPSRSKIWHQCFSGY